MIDIDYIKNLITKLESRGIDVSLEKTKIYGTQNNMGSATISLSQNDSELIDVYNSLKRKLEKSDLLLSAYNYCNSIQADVLKMYDMALKSKDKVNINDFEKYISKIENYLINLDCYKKINLNIDKNRSTNMDFNSIALTRIYEIVYYLIDIDILLTNRSRLYNFIKDKKIYTEYINSILWDEIDRAFNNHTPLTREANATRRLYSVAELLDKDGKKGDYFYLEIIKLLLAYKSDYDIDKSLSDEMNEYYKGYDDTKYKILLAINDTNECLNLKNECYEDKKMSKKDLKNRLLSLLLSISIFVTGGLFIGKLRKRIFTKECFTKTTETISSISDDTQVEKDEYFTDNLCFSNDNPDTYIPSEKYLYVLGPWQNDKKNNISRSVERYDVSYSDLSEYDNLDSIDLDSLEIEPDSYTETIEKEDAINLSKYKGSIRKLENIDYNYEGIKFDAKDYKDSQFAVYYIYIFFSIIANCLIFLNFNEKENLILLAQKFINNKNKYIDSQDELEELICILNKYIEGNQDLIFEFNRLYEENKYLLLDEEELKNRLNDMIIQIEKSNNDMNMTLKYAKK